MKDDQAFSDIIFTICVVFNMILYIPHNSYKEQAKQSIQQYYFVRFNKMTDKEFKHLNRSELIEVIYQLQRNELQYQQTIDSLKRRLDSKEHFLAEKISAAGSIAEAALSINGVVEAAQKAADTYINEVHRLNETAESKSKALIAQAEVKSKDMLEEAENKSNAMLGEARAKSTALISEAEKQAEDLKTKTEQETSRLRSEAEHEIAARWQEFQIKAQELIRMQNELKTLLK